MREKEANLPEKNDGLGPDVVKEILDYLRTKEGHEAVQGVIAIIDKAAAANRERKIADQQRLIEENTLRLQQDQKYRKLMLWLQFGVFVISIGVVATLLATKKYDPTLAVIIGTLAGYFFGRRSTN